ncbi:hypothetical protein LSAT2_003101 [Lamellibrachia satsuma]|nr:hypothetical protein LSAT2_003101 [Lamellibrachia satsuma]
MSYLVVILMHLLPLAYHQLPCYLSVYQSEPTAQKKKIKTRALSGKIPTVGGNAGGAPCVFPFIYLSRTYHDCIRDRFTKEIWCSTVANYDVAKKWGVCTKKPTCQESPCQRKGTCEDFGETGQQCVCHDRDIGGRFCERYARCSDKKTCHAVAQCVDVHYQRPLICLKQRNTICMNMITGGIRVQCHAGICYNVDISNGILCVNRTYCADVDKTGELLCLCPPHHKGTYCDPNELTRTAAKSTPKIILAVLVVLWLVGAAVVVGINLIILSHRKKDDDTASIDAPHLALGLMLVLLMPAVGIAVFVFLTSYWMMLTGKKVESRENGTNHGQEDKGNESADKKLEVTVEYSKEGGMD